MGWRTATRPYRFSDSETVMHNLLHRESPDLAPQRPEQRGVEGEAARGFVVKFVCGVAQRVWCGAARRGALQRSAVHNRIGISCHCRRRANTLCRVDE